MLNAELLIAAEDFPAARKAMGTLAETAPTARSLTIMAAIERGEGASDTAVQSWLARAVTASRGEAWVCGKCDTAHKNWEPLCNRCQGFDTLTWQTTSTEDTTHETAAGMLPLIPGSAKELEHEDAGKAEAEPLQPEQDQLGQRDEEPAATPPVADYVTKENSGAGNERPRDY